MSNDSREVPQVRQKGFMVFFRAETEEALEEIFALAKAHNLPVVCANALQCNYNTKYRLQGDVDCANTLQAETFINLLSSHRPYDPTA